MAYTDLSRAELEALKRELEREYETHRAKGLSLNMARGKPCAEQVALCLPMLDTVNSASDLIAEDGSDCRNYGTPFGLIEARRLMSELTESDPELTVVLGNSSLNIMFDLINQGYVSGFLGNTPWKDLPSVKWICLVPGYDRHFAMLERYGIEMIPVALREDGPDMDTVEQLVANDASIKGMWCVPQYSNPSGDVYSDEAVRRLGAMDTAADDFRIFWDNAYCVHHLYSDRKAHVADLGAACEAGGHPDRYFKFASTSKVSFPGAGIAAVSASEANLAELKARLTLQTVGGDKLNQLRHARFFKDKAGIEAHMEKHAEIIRPKFELVEGMLEEALGETGCATWTKPNGGYFISFTGLPNTAKRTFALAKAAGVLTTDAGATWPYKQDPNDANIRIAPTQPTCEVLAAATEIFCCCVKLAAVESLLA